MKKTLKIIITFAVCLTISCTTVFAGNSVTQKRQRLGTPQDWEDLKKEISSDQKNLNDDISTYGIVTNGVYPRTKGDILVTSTYFSWQDKKSWVGHAGIVFDSQYTLEAFPSRSPTVQYQTNDWRYTYPSQDVYGLKVTYATPAQKKAAADYCASRNSSGQCYDLLAGKASDTYVNCASLVWHGYKKSSGISISNNLYGTVITPISLVDSDQTTIVYKKVTQ